MKKLNNLSNCTRKLFFHTKGHPQKYLHPSECFVLLSVGPADADTLLQQWTQIRPAIVTSVIGVLLEKQRSVFLSWA